MKENMVKKFKLDTEEKLDQIKKSKKTLTKILKAQQIFSEDQEYLMKDSNGSKDKSRHLEMATEVNEAINTTDSIFK